MSRPWVLGRKQLPEAMVFFESAVLQKGFLRCLSAAEPFLD